MTPRREALDKYIKIVNIKSVLLSKNVKRKIYIVGKNRDSRR